MDNKQTATERVVRASRKNPYAPDDENRRIHYTYTRYTGYCPNADESGRHHSATTFIGVNENGWIFECRYHDPPHLFVNEPPSGATVE